MSKVNVGMNLVEPIGLGLFVMHCPLLHVCPVVHFALDGT